MNKKKLPKWLVISGMIMLGASLSGTAAAALNYYSQNYIAQMDVKSIGVTLNENDKAISWRDYTHSNDTWKEHNGDLLTNMLSDAGDDQLILNKHYKEELSVTNSGTIDEYVRVQLYHYWVTPTEDGELQKRTDLDPQDILIGYTGNEEWIEDTDSRTPEKSDWYYTKILTPGKTTSLLCDYIAINGKIAYKVHETSTTEESTDENGVTHKYTNIISTYDYDGTSFVLRADVDAVQTHNAKDAILSAWGVNMDVKADGTLYLLNK
ncbi:MAG: hypothetical protein K6G13_10625 [Agathobacter sp.]|uniref:hypothetical protein n=1 Tax=Agathobacter sp. TaxID=2021311 RepID=UPI002584FC04|nr:hypothetical protein [Agathobacter sp.]MCR5678470.1 hypothetical protein [Agathobacter sp.]